MGNLKRENYSPLARAVSLKTMNKKTVLLILVDGMRHDYINPVDSPFLDALRKQNIDAVVRETFAFELRPAFFAGLQPDECDIANMFYYDPANSPFRSIDVSHGDRAKITLELRAEAEKRGYSLAKYVGGCADIPLELLKYFDFSEKYHTADPGSIANHKTLFDYLRNDGKKWLWIAYPDGPAVTAGVLDKFLTTVTGGEDFIYLHFSELDWVGHEFGPHSLEQKRTLMEIDEAIRKIFCKLNQSFSEVRSVIFGDHGQVEIKKNIDIESKLKKTGLVLEKDYLYFIDSTQARFWFYNDTAKKKVIDLLRAIPDGKILTAADYKRLQFRFKHNKFGELIFVVNDGVGIFPNFFQHSSPCKGLHGYLPEVEGNWAKLIVTGCGIDKKIDSPVEMVSLFPTLLELLDYRKPSSLLVQSIFERENIRVATEKYSASIVIPTYNRLHTLKKCIAAIEKQGYPKEKFELIVVNDGSADGTEGFLEEYQKDTKLNFKYFNQVNTGPAAARNIGIKNAEGYIIILIGDDMIMGPEFVENHIDFHQVWPQISHACLGFIDWSQDIALNTIMDLITSKDGGQQFCWHIIEEQDPDNIIWSVFWSSNISFKRNFSLTHGLFNADFFKHAMWEDVELGYRLSRAGLILHFRKTVKVFHEHFITFESFAKRQRMVGWYSQGLPAMGLSMNYSPNDDKRSRIYSDKVFKFITGILSQPTVETACNNKEILREIYNYGLHYAGLTGYVEKENGLTEDVEGGLGLLLNLSRAERQLDDKNLQLAKHMQELEGRDRLLLENELIITERDGQIANIEAAIKEKDANIEDLEGLLREREAEAGGLRAGLEEKERKIGNLQETMNQKATQISHLEGMVSEKDGEIGNLQEAINQKATQISQLESVGWEREATLNHIYNSHGWKALLAYYRARNRLLPVGTRRRKFAVSIFKLLLVAPQITNKANVIRAILSRPKDNCPMRPAEGLGERGAEETRIVDSVLSAASLPITQSSPCVKKSAMKRKRILLVSYYCPARSHAGGLRILDIYRLIKAKFPDVGLDLYTCRHHEIDGSYKDVEDIYDNIFYSTTDELTVSDLLNQCQIRPSYDVIDLQFHQSARHIDEFRTLGAKILFTPMESLVRSQFIDAQEAFRRTHRFSLKAMVAGVRQATKELKICLKADEVICVSRSDAAFLRAISLSKKIKYFETGISNIEFQDTLDNLSLALTPEDKKNTILYIAYFGSETNVVALKWYLENVHPLIKVRVPDYILRVIGRGDLSVFSNYREESIDFVGEVTSIGPYIDKAKVGIAPALGGAGFRGKVNQYAIFGVPSVVSPIAAKGLAYENEVDIFIAEKPEDFAERCVLLLMDNEINKKIGHKARKTAFLNYSWESKLDMIKQTYKLDGDILMNKPKVTALVPSFNHGRYLRQRIESVLQQTYPNVELIVIDDCSEDDSDDVIKSLQAQYGFKFIRNAHNSGTPFAAWERILSLGTGEYIWICESDDYADHRFLEVTVNALMHNKGAVVAYCDSWIVDDQGRKVDHTDTYFHKIWRESRWDQDFVRTGASELNDFQLRGQTVPNMSSALFSSHAFKQAYHPFLKNFKLTGDWLFVGRILGYGSVVFCKQTLNYFRRHEVTSRVRVKSACSQAEFILTKYILFRATGQPVREFASVMSTDVVRFLYEPAGFFDVLRALFNISVLKTLQCGVSLAASLAMNGHLVKKFWQRHKLVKGGN